MVPSQLTKLELLTDLSPGLFRIAIAVPKYLLLVVSKQQKLTSNMRARWSMAPPYAETAVPVVVLKKVVV
jgi:hypothetical protein